FLPEDFFLLWLETTGVVCAVIGLAAGVFVFFLPKGRRLELLSRLTVAVAVGFYLLFLFDGFVQFLTPGDEAASVLVAAFLLLVLIAVCIVFYFSRWSEFSVTALIFAAVPFTLAVPAMAGTLSAVINGPGTAAAPTVIADTDDTPRPNVYYFITDAFVSAAVLKELFEYDLSGFVGKMEKFGFYHADETYSSYNMTSYTISSILQGNYFLNESSPILDRRHSELLYPRMIRRNETPETISKAKETGYEFYLVGNNWGRCGGPHVLCYDDNETSYLSQTFWSATPIDFIVPADIGAPFAPTKNLTEEEAKGWQSARAGNAIDKVINHLRAEGPPDAPRFTFVHHLAPHPPYLYFPDCTERSSYKVDFRLWSKEAREYYLANLECTERKITAVAEEIVRRDPSAIIVFQADHGSAFSLDGKWSDPFTKWEPIAIRERSSVLNLIRMPQNCRNWLYPSISNVNTVRVVLACINGTEPDLVEDRSYVGTYAESGPNAGRLRRIDPRTNAVYPAEQ
uniref:sulfatase-like hydrolase/transferase n=1 Tax=uncultured Nitratireductor sp. TaxID=520953 RepID=UPI0025FCFC02